MYLRLLAESLRHGSRRKLLAATAVALGLVAATSLSALLLTAGDRLALELGSYGANLVVLPAEGRETFDAAGLVRLRKIFWSNNIVAAAPLLPLRVRYRALGAVDGAADGAGGGGSVAPLVGTWFDVAVDDAWRSGLPAVRPTLRVAGRWPSDRVEPSPSPVPAAEVAVGRRLAERLGVGVGDTVEAEVAGRRASLAVVGTVESGGDEEEAAFAPLAAVEALTGRPATSPAVAGTVAAAGGAVPRAEIFALTNPEAKNLRDPKAMTPEEYDRWYCTAYPSAIAYQIGEALPDARAEVVRAITTATADLAGRLRPVLAVLAVVALAGAALGVAAVAAATVVERRLEAGLAVALGAEVWKVSLFFLSEAALLGLAGGLVGGALGLAGGRLLGVVVFGMAVPVAPLAPVVVPVAAGAGALLAVAGSLPAVLRPWLRDPAAILKRATA